jgi:spore germination protein
VYIHVVQPSETIDSIAALYGVTIASLIRSNGLVNPFSLVPGQTIVIANPSMVHSVAEGETLLSIAAAYNITPLQLLRNNPFLSDSDTLYAGETLIISYEVGREVTTNGFAYQYINLDTLRKTLPFLTYLSIYNYVATAEGDISSYYDDSEIISLAKEYGTIPLMLLTTLTTQGTPNPQIASQILNSEEYQTTFFAAMIRILKEKGLYGVNIFYSYMTAANKESYDRFTEKLYGILKQEGYLLLITINPVIENSGLYQEDIDYTYISQYSDSIAFLRLIWGTNKGPPIPVISINALQQFVAHVLTTIPNSELVLGLPVIGYSWELPYQEGETEANSLTINAALTIASDAGATIQFDDVSQTPYYFYDEYRVTESLQHIVRFIDARTTNGIMNLIAGYGLIGIGIWNVMIFYDQLWLIINSQYQIIKLMKDTLQDL